MKKQQRIITALFVAVVATLALAGIAGAAEGISSGAGEAMPWEGPLDRIMKSITGPVAKVIGVLAVVATGFGFAMSEGGTTMKKIMGVVFGLAIAFAGSTWVLKFFEAKGLGF